MVIQILHAYLLWTPLMLANGNCLAVQTQRNYWWDQIHRLNSGPTQSDTNVHKKHKNGFRKGKKKKKEKYLCKLAHEFVHQELLRTEHTIIHRQ